MKNTIALILFILIFIPSIVSAHTGLSSSNPAEGQVVATELSEITLSYEGSIEKLSTMKLVSDGAEIPFEQIQVVEKQMVGTLAKTLENGSYQIQWSIAGEDGHPIKGEINFSVQMIAKSEVPAPDLSDTDQVKKDEEQPVTESEQQDQTKETDLGNTNEDAATKSTSTRTTMLIGLVVIIGIGFVFLIRKKR
jgi:copper resistance protein C